MGYFPDWIKMDDFERKVVQEHFAQLKRELVPGDLADLMYSKGIIGREVLNEVEAIPIQDKKNRRLLMALEDSPNQQAFSLFLDCIEEADSVMWPIITQLRDALAAAKMPKPVACSDDVAEVGRVTDTSHLQSSKRRWGDKPSLLDCQQFGIVSKMASDWYTFAVYLGLEDDADNVDANYRFVQDKCTQAITLWLKGSGKKHSNDPITWHTLHGVIKKIYPAFAEELNEMIE